MVVTAEENWLAGHWADKIGSNYTIWGGFIPTQSTTDRVIAYSVDPGNNTQFFINTEQDKVVF